MAVTLDDLRQLPLPAVAPRTLLGIGLAAVAAVLVLVVTQPPASVPVLVAGTDLPAGTPLSELEVEVRQVESSAGLVTGDELGELGDWVLASPIAAGEPLLPSLLRPVEALAAPDTIAIQLDSAHAVLGQLSAGDRVDVFATTSRPGIPAETVLIATSIYVLEAGVTDASAGPDRVELLLAVDRSTARALTTAMHAGEIDLVKVGS
jgi:Flp pilus assembly protein CpaB